VPVCRRVSRILAIWSLSATFRSIATGGLEAHRRSSIGSQLQYSDLDALPQTGPGLGVEADLLFTLASHPPEAVSHKFDAIRFVVDIAPGRLGQTLHQLRTIEEHTHLGIQFA
jgi:hypothetical protein